MSKKSHKSAGPDSKRINSSTNRAMFSKGRGIDKKYFIFGEVGDDKECGHFLGSIKKMLRLALDGLLSSAEVYYRQKGNRHVTRPQALQETFEIFADVVTTKLESYHKQADEYHNECLQELRRQVSEFEDLLGEIPVCVVDEFLADCKLDTDSQQQALDTQFAQQLKAWNEAKAEHSDELRPALGHPNAREELTALMEREEERHLAYIAGVEQHTKTLQEAAAGHSSEFIVKLAALSESMINDFDVIITIDDIERGRVPTAKYPTSELVRRRNAGKPLEDDNTEEKITRGKMTIKGIPKNEMLNPNAEIPREQMIKEKASRRGRDGKKKEPPSNLTPTINTERTTMGHRATIEQRDSAYQAYKAHFEASLRRIEEQKESQLLAEQRWTDSWFTSVDKVQRLYVRNAQFITPQVSATSTAAPTAGGTTGLASRE